MSKILISSCLLGRKVRYDGKDNLQENPKLYSLLHQDKVVAICPEVAGGMPVPRTPCEIKSGRVIDINKNDRTKEFQLGAQKTLELAKQNKVSVAILKARSPSCGSKEIYNGKFSKQLILGQGVTAKLLKENGILVFDETEIELAINCFLEKH